MFFDNYSDELQRTLGAIDRSDIEKLEACLEEARENGRRVFVLGNGGSAAAFGSQGQVRTCTLSLKLAERELFFQEDGEYPVLLLDDVLSELDRRRQDFVLNRIADGQVMITCCEDGISDKLRAGAVFHIKNGKII